MLAVVSMAQFTIQKAFDLALQHHQAGRRPAAEQIYRQILAQEPGHFDALNNLGAALGDRGELDQAILCYRAALAVKPDSPTAHNNLGSAFQDKGQPEQAIGAYQRAIELQPGFSGAYGNLGAALKDAGQLDEAIAAYRQALALDPDNFTIDSRLLYTLHFHPAYDANAIAGEHRRWNRRHAEALQKLVRPHLNDRSIDRRLRVGYVSPDFREHVVGRNLLPLFRRHDHRAFDVFCYSNVRRPDAMTNQFQQNSDCWRNIAGLTDEQAATQIIEDRIDILVDLTLHMANNRLMVFARKPAPVQVTFAGYPASSGLSAIDYRLSDPYLDPFDGAQGGPPGMDESIYSEKTIRLPDSFWCYDPLDCRDVPINPLPLERDVVTFGCLNNFCKINDGVLVLWAQVLRQVERSRLLLLAPEGSHRERTRARLAQEGVEPARVEFVSHRPRRQYLELYHRIDVGLDSFPYNGHTTSLDSLVMGVPVVTLVGQTAVARAGWCQLSNLGLTELAANTPEQFVRIAVKLARDLPRLRAMRSTLRRRMEQSPLMDAPRFARNIEAAYRRMWRTWSESTSARC
jgi:predicted O-linked N-acetylglucosamine transferase (SPINDLY family)